MRTESLTKSAVDENKLIALSPLGKAVYNSFMRAYGKAPLSKIYSPVISASTDPSQVNMYRDAVRTMQGQAAGRVADIGAGSLLFGLGVGAGRHVPKLLAAKRELSEDDETPDEPEMIGLKESVLMKLAKFSDLNWFPGQSQAMTAPEQGPANVADVVKEWSFGDIPRAPWQVQVGSLPPGSAIPAMLAAGTVPLLAGDKLMDMITDKVRAKMVARKKKEVQKRFQSLLTGSRHTPGNEMVTKMAEAYEKQAKGPNLAGVSAGVATVMAALMAGGGAFGYQMSKNMHPDNIRKKQLEAILKRKKKEKPISIMLEPDTRQEATYGIPEPVSSLSREHYRLPVYLPPRRKAQTLFNPPDEALDLSKISQYLMKSGGVDVVENATNVLRAPSTDPYTVPTFPSQAAVERRLGDTGPVVGNDQLLDPSVENVGGVIKNLMSPKSVAAGIEKEIGMPMAQVKGMLAQAQTALAEYAKLPRKPDGTIDVMAAVNNIPEGKAILANAEQAKVFMDRYKPLIEKWGPRLERWGDAAEGVGTGMGSALTTIKDILKGSPEILKSLFTGGSEPAPVEQPVAQPAAPAPVAPAAPAPAAPVAPEVPAPVMSSASPAPAVDEPAAFAQVNQNSKNTIDAGATGAANAATAVKLQK